MSRRYRHAALLIGAVCLLCGCSGFQKSLFDCSMSMEHRLSKLWEKSVQAGGLTFSYLERSGPGETVVLLHGFGADKDNWVRFVRHLPKEYRVIAIDLPGHGSTTRDAHTAYTVDYLTQGFADAVQALNLDRFHLAGNSLGGFVSVIYSAGNPGRVSSLCLIDPAGAASPQPSDLQLAVERGENPLVPKSREDFDALMAYGFHNRPFIPWFIINVLADRYIERSAFNEKMWNDIHRHQKDVVPYLGALKMPVFLIWGDKDRVLHVSSVSVYRQHIPQVETLILQNCGHVPMLELPRITAGHYTEFLEKPSQGPRAPCKGDGPGSE